MKPLEVDPWAKWGAIGSVVGGISSLLGLAFVAFAGIVAYRIFKVERTRDRQAELREQRADAFQRRQQAAAIGFWHSGNGIWMLTNHSSVPIYEVHVGTVRAAPEAGDFEKRKIDFVATTNRNANFYDFLGPTHELAFDLHHDEFELPGCVAFTDNAGNRWFREYLDLKEFDEIDDETHAALLEALDLVRLTDLARSGGVESA